MTSVFEKTNLLQVRPQVLRHKDHAGCRGLRRAAGGRIRALPGGWDGGKVQRVPGIRQQDLPVTLSSLLKSPRGRRPADLLACCLYGGNA